MTINDAAAATFVVVCRRHDGREREWQRYADRAEAERAASRLTAIGCPSRVTTNDELAPNATAPAGGFP